MNVTVCPGCNKKAPAHRIERTYGNPSGLCVEVVATTKVENGRHPYEPFCTLRCALRYARRMHKKFGTMFRAAQKKEYT